MDRLAHGLPDGRLRMAEQRRGEVTQKVNVLVIVHVP
jgi:hypothetical protein